MVNKSEPSGKITLEVAAFLDSSEARALEGVSCADSRRIVELFVRLCYEHRASRPALMDGGDMHAVVGHLMPAHLRRRDPLAEGVPTVLRAFLDHHEKDQVVVQIFELRQALESTLDEFQAAVRTGENAHRAHTKQEPLVHRAEKTGRNDPCPCGSGKKFKKCHG